MTDYTLTTAHLSDSDGGDGYDGTYSYGMCLWDDTHVVYAYSEDDNYNRNVVQLVEISSDGTLTPLTTLAYKDESVLGDTSDVDTSQNPPSVIRTGDLLVVLDNKGLQTFTISGSTITQVGTDDAPPFAGPLGFSPASFCQIVAWEGGDLLYGTRYGVSVTTGQVAFAHWTGSAWTWGSTYVHPDSHFDGAGNSMAMSRLYTADDPTAVIFRRDDTLTDTDERLGVLTGSYPDAPTYADGPVTALSYSWSPDELQPSASGDILHVGVSDFTHDNWAWTAEIISPDGSGNITISAGPVVLLPTAFYGDGWSITTKQDSDGTYWMFLTQGNGFGDSAANVYHLAVDGTILATYPLPDEGDGGPNYNEMSWNVSTLSPGGFVSGYYTYNNALMYGVVVGVASPATPVAPDFHFTDYVLDATKPHLVEITFLSSSEHDGGGRGFYLTGVREGMEAEDFAAIVGGPGFANLYDGAGNTQTHAAITIGPGEGSWDDPSTGVAAGYDRLWLRTDVAGAVSEVAVTKICTTPPPPPPPPPPPVVEKKIPDPPGQEEGQPTASGTPDAWASDVRISMPMPSSQQGLMSLGSGFAMSAGGLVPDITEETYKRGVTPTFAPENFGQPTVYDDTDLDEPPTDLAVF